MRARWLLFYICGLLLLLIAGSAFTQAAAQRETGVESSPESTSEANLADPTNDNARRLIEEGKRTFRFDTFGDEAFWGGALQLHTAIEGAKFGGVGPGVSPRTALAVGLKVDADAL